MQTQWTDRPVVDNRYSPVGKVTDVLFADQGGTPRWATIKTGFIGERVTPLDGAYVSDDGVLVLPFDERTIKHAPKAPRDHVLTREVAAEVAAYFDLA